jgi:hypothetical protein
MDDGGIRARLDALGVVAWDTAPPEQGRIRFLDPSGTVVAQARFRVILSYGPGDIGYTMGWNVAAYRTAGIPFVGREEAGEPAVVYRALRDEAWQRGQKIVAKIGAQGAYWAATLLLAIDDLVESAAGASSAPTEGERIAELARALFTAEELPVELDPYRKRPIYEALREAGQLRPEMVTMMVFVLEGDLNEIAVAQKEVTAGDVSGLISAYWKLPAWRPRADLIDLLKLRCEAELEPVWLDILRAPDGRAEDSIHMAKAVALARLDGDLQRWNDYWYDWPLTQREAKRRLEARGRA